MHKMQTPKLRERSMIKTVAILGAGAIGSYFINGLSDKLDEGLWVVAEGERAERLCRDGIVMNGRRFELNVRTPEEARGADLLIIALKYGALRPALSQIESVVDERTIVLCPMNGVDKEQIVDGRIGEGRTLPSLMKMAVLRVEGGFTYDPEVARGVFFGEADGSRSERVVALEELFDGTPIVYHVSEHIIEDIWYKFALNVSRNLPQAILNCGFGAYAASEHVAYLSQRLRDEVVAVAAAQDIDISGPNPVGVNSNQPPYARFSTLQDLDAGRPTEIDMFSGTVIRMGREFGVPTPYNDFAYHAIKALEEKNAGVFV